MRRPDVFTLDYSHPLAQGLVFAGMCSGNFIDVSLLQSTCVPINYGDISPIVFNEDIGKKALQFIPSLGTRIATNFYLPTGSSPRTLSCWIKTTVNAQKFVFGGGGGMAGADFNLMTETGGFSVDVYSGNHRYVAGILDGNWHHICAVLPSGATTTDELLGYVDGLLAQDGSINSRTIATTTTYPLYFGRLARHGTSYTGWDFGGMIVDPMIHDRALSPAEIALLADRTDPMLGGLIVDERPVLWFDMGGSTTDELTASNLTVSSPVLGTPALGQAHALTATGITVEGPVLGAPTLAQIHALVASGLTVSAPVVGTPTLAEVDENTDALFADDLVVGSPVLGTPTLGQVHALTASDLVISSPVLGTPAVSDGTEQPSTRSGGGGGYAAPTRKQKAKKKKPVVIESSTKSEREKIEEIARILDGPEPQEVAAQPQPNAEPAQEETSTEQPSIVAIPQSSPPPLLITSPLDLIESEAMTAARDAATQETRRVVEEQQRIAMMRMRDEDDATALIMIFASI